MKTEHYTGRRTEQHTGDWADSSPLHLAVQDQVLMRGGCCLTHTSSDLLRQHDTREPASCSRSVKSLCFNSHVTQIWKPRSHCLRFCCTLSTFFFCPVMKHAAGDQSLNVARSSTAMWGSRQLPVISVRQTGYNEDDWLMHQNQQKHCVQSVNKKCSATSHSVYVNVTGDFLLVTS